MLLLARASTEMCTGNLVFLGMKWLTDSGVALTPNGCVPRGSSLVRLHLKVLVIGCLDSGLFRFPRNA